MFKKRVILAILLLNSVTGFSVDHLNSKGNPKNYIEVSIPNTLLGIANISYERKFVNNSFGLLGQYANTESYFGENYMDLNLKNTELFWVRYFESETDDHWFFHSGLNYSDIDLYAEKNHRLDLYYSGKYLSLIGLLGRSYNWNSGLSVRVSSGMEAKYFLTEIEDKRLAGDYAKKIIPAFDLSVGYHF